MAWDIDLTPISNPAFRKIHQRLLLSYLAVITVILGGFSASIYVFVVRHRNHQLDTQLRQVAQTAAGTLGIIQHEYEEISTQVYNSAAPDTALPSVLSLQELVIEHEPGNLSQAGLDPLTSIMADDLGVEWFNAQRRLIVKEGGFSVESFPEQVPAQGILEQDGQIRYFILPVYSSYQQQDATLIGFVRATASTHSLEAEFSRFRGSLALGVLAVSGFIFLGGIWLTSESLKPVVKSMEQLKQFTSDASHELRTPLTAIAASVAVMQNHPERIHIDDIDKLMAIASASQQMGQIINDLLLLTRLDQQVNHHHAWVLISLDEMLEDLVLLYREAANQKNIALLTHIRDHLDVLGDSHQLQRLFTNLLSNALQYTPFNGSITLTLRRSQNYAIILVEDTGIGIAPEQIPHIFERFWRSEEARHQNGNGSGLGLAIVQGIAQQHQGTVTVQSTLGKGSCFQVALPLPAR